MINCKRIVKSQNIRFKIIEFLKFIPDKTMIKIEYYLKTGNRLNLSNPKRYTEKLQWYKLYYHDQLLKECADKYSVRKYIEGKGYNYILNELYAVYESSDDFNLKTLPDSFAIKCSVGGGLNYFVQNKNNENEEELKKMIDRWLKKDYRIYGFDFGREWSYKKRKPKILIEKLLPRNENNDIPDYKFFCFNGKVFCLYTMIDYTDNHENGKLGFFDKNFKLLPYYRNDFAPITKQISPPKSFKKMVEIAEKLSKDFPHVRVDFYDVLGEPIFGELTFYNASGFTNFKPDEFDYILGEKFILPEKRK